MTNILFNDSVFEVTKTYNDGEIQSIKRTSEPFIEVDVMQKDNTL